MLKDLAVVSRWIAIGAVLFTMGSLLWRGYRETTAEFSYGKSHESGDFRFEVYRYASFPLLLGMPGDGASGSAEIRVFNRNGDLLLKRRISSSEAFFSEGSLQIAGGDSVDLEELRR